ncbi:MAG: 4Fe-4S dicluster domain-containing protein [Thermodesulfobacteriota bacterium]
MLYKVSLFVSLILFGMGLLWKISGWFRYRTSLVALDLPLKTRISEAVRGILLTLFSRKVLTLVRVLFLDGVLQCRFFKEDPFRWSVHLCMFGGFVFLLLTHALDKAVMASLFRDYSSTLNPFLFLRDFFGAWVILGLILSFSRRILSKRPALPTPATDLYAIVLLALIMISGVLLEGTKIISYAKFREMVEDYAVADTEEEIRSLESFWVQEYGIVSPRLTSPFDAETLGTGRETHEMKCAGCHSSPQWAFMGYGAAKALKPGALFLDKLRGVTWLWMLHFMLCFAGLAYLPFSKFFHILTGPLSLVVHAVIHEEGSHRANRAIAEAIALDACTHCGTCSTRCSVAVILKAIPNVNILPSEKIASLKRLAFGRRMHPTDLRMIQEGIYLCTNCNRCTAVCPVGINLKSLWFNVREYLIRNGYPEPSMLSPLSFCRGLMMEGTDLTRDLEPAGRAMAAVTGEYDGRDRGYEAHYVTPSDTEFRRRFNLSEQGKTFTVCFGCRTCTTVCPVVNSYDNPGEALGLLPHQIMHSLALGLRGLSLGSRMLWRCLTCYECQELCPQGVRVTDIFYELKNLAFEGFKEKTWT